jgi:hypothetical protein
MEAARLEDWTVLDNRQHNLSRGNSNQQKGRKVCNMIQPGDLNGHP